MRHFFTTAPDGLVEAACMDGMSEFAVVWRVMLPTAVPALGISPVVARWNEHFRPRIVVSGDRSLVTPPWACASSSPTPAARSTAP